MQSVYDKILSVMKAAEAQNTPHSFQLVHHICSHKWATMTCRLSACIVATSKTAKWKIYISTIYSLFCFLSLSCVKEFLRIFHIGFVRNSVAWLSQTNVTACWTLFVLNDSNLYTIWKTYNVSLRCTQMRWLYNNSVVCSCSPWTLSRPHLPSYLPPLALHLMHVHFFLIFNVNAWNTLTESCRTAIFRFQQCESFLFTLNHYCSK